ncbi:MAG TPA: hypothetical protein VI756_04690 [Blastocatellia bacterium]
MQVIDKDPITVIASDIKEARRSLPLGDQAELEAFAARQLKSRRRATAMLRFYEKFPCHMSRVHLLAGFAVMLGRFAGHSHNFDAMGDAFMPVDAAGNPRNEAWAEYAAACAKRMKWEVRDELWLTAHMEDMEATRRTGLDAAFYDEASTRQNDLTWRLLKQHMEVTVGARMLDGAALAGALAPETAMGHSLGVTVTRLFTRCAALLWYYARESARAMLRPSGEPRREVLSYRRAAFKLMRYSVTAWTAYRVFRRGLRQKERGRVAAEEGWPLLEQVLGDQVGQVDPAIVAFYTNPARHKVKASIKLHTTPARLWSWFATILIGQGLYESDMDDIDARFKIFRRADGSMHFVRELYCGTARRVFDSDFIVRGVNGHPAFFEVFVDLKLDVEMELRPLPGGGLSIRCRRLYFRGVRAPRFGLQVEFTSRTVTAPEGHRIIRIEGKLLMEPGSRIGQLISYRLLRRPKLLGSIKYTAVPLDALPLEVPATEAPLK